MRININYLIVSSGIAFIDNNDNNCVIMPKIRRNRLVINTSSSEYTNFLQQNIQSKVSLSKKNRSARQEVSTIPLIGAMVHWRPASVDSVKKRPSKLKLV